MSVHTLEERLKTLWVHGIDTECCLDVPPGVHGKASTHWIGPMQVDYAKALRMCELSSRLEDLEDAELSQTLVSLLSIKPKTCPSDDEGWLFIWAGHKGVLETTFLAALLGTNAFHWRVHFLRPSERMSALATSPITLRQSIRPCQVRSSLLKWLGF